MQIGRWLEQAGAIAPLRFEKNVDRSKQIECFRKPTKSLALEYFNELSKTHRAYICLRTLTFIRHWDDFLEPQFILTATAENANHFINTLPEVRLPQKSCLLQTLKAFYRWLLSQSYVESNPFSKIELPKARMSCSSCGQEKIFYGSRPQCDRCLRVPTIFRKLKDLEAKSINLSEYSHDIFKLYLRYLRRHQIYDRQLHECKEFYTFLENKKYLVALISRSSVLNLSEEFKAFRSQAVLKQNCPVLKVAYVLQDLGILPIREEAYDFGIDKIINDLSLTLSRPLQLYVDQLRRTRRHERTVYLVVLRIKHFHDWMTKNYQIDFWLASEAIARHYLLVCDQDVLFMRNLLRRFYKWAILEKYTLSNPFENIDAPKKLLSMKVCSPEQIKRIERFIRASSSDPEAAMILALVFYW